MDFDFIVAVDNQWGISTNNVIPWATTPMGAEDMKHFVNLTKRPSSAVIMGRKTWESISKERRPLKGRVNIIITSNASTIDNTDIVCVDALIGALNWCRSHNTDHVWVIGGASIYQQALTSQYLRYGYVTILQDDFQCDKFFPREILETCSTKMSSKITTCGNEYRIYTFKEGQRL